MRRHRWFLVALLPLLALAGCTGDEAPARSSQPSSRPFPLATFDWDRRSADQALVSGELHEQDGCLYASGTVALMWPNGFTAVKLSDGTVVVSNFDGVEIARTGEQISAGGGTGPARGFPCRGVTHAFLIQDAMAPSE